MHEAEWLTRKHRVEKRLPALNSPDMVTRLNAALAN
jgi:hypothetical protein